MKNILFISLLFTLVSCGQPAATSDTVNTSTASATPTLAAQLTSVPPTAIPISSPIPTTTPVPPTASACMGASGSWGTPPDGKLSIIFTIQDCKITAVIILGIIEGQWVTVSNEANEPINGSEFNFLYSFTDQDRYNLSGTFTSPTSASIQLVIFKGFTLTVGQPSPLNDDLIIDAIANLGEE